MYIFKLFDLLYLLLCKILGIISICLVELRELGSDEGPQRVRFAWQAPAPQRPRPAAASAERQNEEVGRSTEVSRPQEQKRRFREEMREAKRKAHVETERDLKRSYI